MRGSEFADLKAFAAIAEMGSFSAAARFLGITPSALSQRMRELEAKLGVRLLNRTTRSVAVSAHGASLLARILPLFDGFERALNELGEERDDASGVLRLNLPRVAAMYLVAPLLGGFQHAHPGVTLDISIDDKFSDIVAGRYDAGIRLGESLEKDMVAVRLGGKRKAMVVASPKLLKRLGSPRVPRDLNRLPCLRFRWPGAKDVYRWEFEKAGKSLEIAVEGPLIVNDTAMMLEAAAQGLGLAYALDIAVAKFVAAGKLTPVLSDWLPPFGGFHLYHPSNRQMPRQLRVFIDFLKARLERDG